MITLSTRRRWLARGARDGVGRRLAHSLLSAESSDTFGALTRYVAQQIESDKLVFIGAQRCTEWFYKQLNKSRLAH